MQLFIYKYIGRLRCSGCLTELSRGRLGLFGLVFSFLIIFVGLTRQHEFERILFEGVTFRVVRRIFLVEVN